MTTALKLLDLIEPVFLFVCRTNRLLRAGIQLPYQDVRDEALACLSEVKAKAQSDARLLRQFELIELPLVFFVDATMAGTRAPWAKPWADNRLAMSAAYGGQEAPNELFFEMLAQCMRDISPDASERLTVYYTCIGLGFVGSHKEQPQILLFLMRQIAERLKSTDFVGYNREQLLPECYKHVNESNLPIPISVTVAPMILCFVALFVLLLSFFVYRYHQDSAELYDIVRGISHSSGPRSSQK